MGVCPYCNKGGISERSSARLWADIIAKALSQVRVFFEVREQSDFSLKKLFKAFVDSDSLPIATEQDRRCPFCRRGYVTKKSADSIWTDLIVRILGMGRTYLEIRGNREDFPIRELAIVIVDGDAAKIPTDNGFNDLRVDVVVEDDDIETGYDDDDDEVVDAEDVDVTPFDDDDDDEVVDVKAERNSNRFAGF